MRTAIKQITKRLKPGQDLKDDIERVVAKYNVQAGCVVSMVGSLKKVSLRMAGAKRIKTLAGLFEIVSATGTLSKDGCHIHISVSDKSGKTIGGHLADGCIIRTTIELVLLKFSGVKYKRLLDKDTGYKELVVE